MIDSAPFPPWPALDLRGQAAPSRLGFERAVWGKMHGAAGDFRWLASSAGLTAQLAGIERELELGSEDAAVRSVLWRALSDRHLAAVCYSSRAVDAAGRSGFLEKQVLVWRHTPEFPPALGSLALLPWVGGLESDVWWERRAVNLWTEAEDVLPLAPEEHLPLEVSPEMIATVIARGIRELREKKIEEDALTELYARLFAGMRGVRLNGLTEPLGAEAVAALLLPLPREIADGLSIAGWLPSTRLPNPDRLRELWTLALGGQTAPPKESQEPSPADHDRGQRLARALLADAPAQLATDATPPRRGSRPIQLAIWGPASAGKTAFLAQLYLENHPDSEWKVFPTAVSLPFIQGMRQYMVSNSAFPPATSLTAQSIEYNFQHPTRGEAVLRMEDRAGSESQSLSEGMRRQLAEADGLILFFDPLAEGRALEAQVWRTLEHVHVASGRGKDERPIAVCFSKADTLIRSAHDMEWALQDPDGFVRHHENMGLVTALERYATRFKLFPVSAAGVRLVYGAVEPVVFFDEALRPRLCPEGKPLHVMAPFDWLLEELK